VVLDIGAEGQLLPVLAVHADLVYVALDGLAEELRAVFRPARRAAGFVGLELKSSCAIETEDEDANVAEVPAGDGEVSAVRTEGRHSAALPFLRRGPIFLAG